MRDLVSESGEEQVKEILSGFLCPLNPDVEQFMHEKALMFARNNFATTYLVFMSYKKEPVLVGYYALAIKPVVIKAKTLNSDWRRRLRRYADYDEELKQFSVALPLIGQLGKNFANDYNKLITGDELLQAACDTVHSIQWMTSGKMAYLECEDIPALTEFYERNGFYRFANRNLDRDELEHNKGKYLVQMIRYFRS